MSNTINTGKKSNGEFTISYQKNGNGGCIPVIDGKPEPALMFGYVSETDKEGAMKVIEEAIRATNGDVYGALQYIMNAVSVAAAEITPDEAVEIDGIEFLINYANKKAYYGTEEIANLDDIGCKLPDEAIKAMLMDRIKMEIDKAKEEEECYDFDPEYDY